MHTRTKNSAFTLIELLVVIAIIAILAVVVVLTLNPAEMMREARDSNRLSDLATLNSALGAYEAQDGNALGAPDTVYVSLPDPTLSGNQTSTCASLNLPALPAGYTYQCSSPQDYRNASGTGWIPVNLASPAVSNILSSLPVDPTNQSSTRLYYTYTTNGTQYEITAPMESSKYQLGGSHDVIVNDGSPLTTVYAKGTNLTLEPLDYGDPSLVGYWPLDEGSGTVAYDGSGNGNNGNWSGTTSGTSGYYSPGLNGGWAGNFNTSNGITNSSPSSALTVNNFSISLWILPTAIPVGGWAGLVLKETGTWPSFYSISVDPTTGSTYGSIMANGGNRDSPGYDMVLGVWQFVTYVHNNTVGTDCFYENGALVGCSGQALTPDIGAGTFDIGGANIGFTGLMNDIRIYNRALSSAEVMALYNAEK